MNRKILTTLFLLISLIFSFTFCFAENESAKNMVNNAENAVKDAGQNASNMVRDAANSAKEGAKNLGNSITNGMNNDYDATRTANEGTFMGMSSNTWSWLILGIAAIAIIALVWYYSIQLNGKKHHDDDRY